MKSMYPHLPIVPVKYSPKMYYTVTAIVSASNVCMSEVILQSYSVNIVEVKVSCSASCVLYTCSEVV